MINNDNLKYELMANRMCKMATLFELGDGLRSFFKENPEEVVNVSFSFAEGMPKEPHAIVFSSSLSKEKESTAGVFSLLYHCVCAANPLESPFGLFTQYLLNKPQKVDFVFNKDNFNFIFKYADDFDGKEEWEKQVVNYWDEDLDYVIVSHDKLWGKYPKTVFNQRSYNLWKEVKSREGYIKSKYEYHVFIRNLELIKKYYNSLTENQTMVLKDSYLTIFEEGKIVDCVEIDNFSYLKGLFNKKDVEKGFNDFINYNSDMLELHIGLTKNLLLNILND